MIILVNFLMQNFYQLPCVKFPRKLNRLGQRDHKFRGNKFGSPRNFETNDRAIIDPKKQTITAEKIIAR